MPTELELFQKGIKPAIMYPEDRFRRWGIETTGLHKQYFRKALILSHNEVPEIKDTDNVKLGVLLGYYPKACERLYDRTIVFAENEMINFGGIKFNTSNLFAECLDWCIKEYEEKMLEHYDRIVVEQWKTKRVDKKQKRELIKTIIIER